MFAFTGDVMLGAFPPFTLVQRRGPRTDRIEKSIVKSVPR